jgi:hypothetical protein
VILPNPQVPSHHAFLHRINGQLFVEDRGAANGTFVRGHRNLRGQQKIGVQSGEKILHRPGCRCGDRAKRLRARRWRSFKREVLRPDCWAGKPLYEIEARACPEVPDRDNPREMKAPENRSAACPWRHMIAPMAPFGRCKTDAAPALNGIVSRPRAAMVPHPPGRRSSHHLRHPLCLIGYVPRIDPSTSELNTRSERPSCHAARNSASLPTHTPGRSETVARVEQTIKDPPLDGARAEPETRKPEKQHPFPGGQRKRVNIAPSSSSPILSSLPPRRAFHWLLAADDN